MELTGAPEATNPSTHADEFKILKNRIEELGKENANLTDKLSRIGIELNTVMRKKLEIEIKQQCIEDKYDHLLQLVIDKI